VLSRQNLPWEKSWQVVCVGKYICRVSARLLRDGTAERRTICPMRPVDEVAEAFELTLDALADAAASVRTRISEEATNSPLVQIAEHVELLRGIEAIAAKANALADEWDEVAPKDTEAQETEAAHERLPRGEKTPQSAFRKPILQALVDLGGSGSVRDVIAKVGETMKDTLKDADYGSLPSSPKSMRWENTAAWERNTMAREGLLKSDSPHGTWEISEAGHEHLARP
jgi:restriction system protein